MDGRRLGAPQGPHEQDPAYRPTRPRLPLSRCLVAAVLTGRADGPVSRTVIGGWPLPYKAAALASWHVWTCHVSVGHGWMCHARRLRLAARAGAVLSPAGGCPETPAAVRCFSRRDGCAARTGRGARLADPVQEAARTPAYARIAYMSACRTLPAEAPRYTPRPEAPSRRPPASGTSAAVPAPGTYARCGSSIVAGQPRWSGRKRRSPSVAAPARNAPPGSRYSWCDAKITFAVNRIRRLHVGVIRSSAS
ncbi:hypothetical protein A8924_1992 [Saccharopolyspora erythraea NRRL 2338]|nr:hypothetical protein A8924_1992 [Saccharopolyspora erythraea NRRL 2338]